VEDALVGFIGASGVSGAVGHLIAGFPAFG